MNNFVHFFVSILALSLLLSVQAKNLSLNREKRNVDEDSVGFPVLNEQNTHHNISKRQFGWSPLFSLAMSKWRICYETRLSFLYYPYRCGEFCATSA